MWILVVVVIIAVTLYLRLLDFQHIQDFGGRQTDQANSNVKKNKNNSSYILYYVLGNLVSQGKIFKFPLF